MAVAFAVAVSGGVAVPVSVPVPVAGLTKRFFNQKDFLINVWGYHGYVTGYAEMATLKVAVGLLCTGASLRA